MIDADCVTVNIEIPFPSSRLAQIALDVLRVDKEPKKTISKQLRVNENILIGTFSGTLARQVRVAVTGFFDSIQLILQTIEFAGEPVSEEYSYY